MAKRYSCPDFLLDGFISSYQLSQFIYESWTSYQDDILWDFWLHKVHDGKSFNDYKETIKKQPAKPVKRDLSQEEIKSVIEDSERILSQFFTVKEK